MKIQPAPGSDAIKLTVVMSLYRAMYPKRNQLLLFATRLISSGGLTMTYNTWPVFQSGSQPNMHQKIIKNEPQHRTRYSTHLEPTGFRTNRYSQEKERKRGQEPSNRIWRCWRRRVVRCVSRINSVSGGAVDSYWRL